MARKKWPSKTRNAKALMQLRAQVNELAPNRDKSSDGIAASKRHSAVNPNSDHEPHVMDGDVGVFTAIDITNDPAHGVSSRAIMQALLDSKDVRVKYVISNAQIASGSGQDHPQGVWRPYKGPNDHRHHGHLSLKGDKRLYDDETPFDLSTFKVKPNKEEPAKDPLLKYGSKGDAVKDLQQLLGVEQDGDFGKSTLRVVIKFQKENGLTADGKVGQYTWDKLRETPVRDETLLKIEREQKPDLAPAEDLPEQLPLTNEPVTKAPVDDERDFPTPPPTVVVDLSEAIMALARTSAIQQYNWKNRGIAPPGYTKGMALSFARAYRDLKAGKDYATLMAKGVGSIDSDALANYAKEFKDIGSDSPLLSVFTLLLGLGMRESSGRHCCGRDTTAKLKASSDSAETGLFQVSFDSRRFHPLLRELMTHYDEKDGLRGVFHEGVSCSQKDLDNYGVGLGRAFQELCKQKPDFAVRWAGCLLRYAGGRKESHWGPIRRKEVEVRKDALKLFEQVRDLVDKQELIS